ncbi:hypothetical protein N1030_13965 [Desulfovibrio mangrovi]|uniref:hypothetical protein n=1 Tax=Desulfovibrio mangrovi TaxID=2976983 RepID=UPI0022480001|nr:hypothetical protein [Desulfovibrio mangrovi]UZP66707.1 hypothetical protein N1030_13965 [Desulfovibrio mangrovi]
MTRQMSFTKIQQEITPAFRQRMDHAESTEDIKKFFVHSMQDLFSRALESDIPVEYEEITLEPESEHGFMLADSLMGRDSFYQTWTQSDLPSIVGYFAQYAVKRFRHLERNPGSDYFHQKQR